MTTSPTEVSGTVARLFAVSGRWRWPAVLMVWLAGCQLMGGTDSSEGPTVKTKPAGLPPVRRPAETVSLEIVFVERPSDDPLLKSDRLWQGVDTVGEVLPNVRQRLLGSGFLVGQSSSAANPALETMLGLTSTDTGLQAPVDQRHLAGRRIFRPAGGEAEVQTSDYFDSFPFPSETTPASAPRKLQHARCVFRIKTEKLQDGWARLEFTPEIHYGRLGWRPIATGLGWKGTTAQNIHRLYSHRFSLTLNTGEMVVLTADRTKPGSLGWRFFMKENDDQPLQRILIIRLADVASNSAVRQVGRD